MRGTLFLLLISWIIAGCTGGNESTVTEHQPSFSYTITRDARTGWHIIRLFTDTGKDSEKNLSAKIVPEAGCNLYSFIAGDHELVHASEDLREFLDRMTGIPPMFPTPNRVRNQTYRFNGETYRMTFPGDDKPKRLHGIARDDTTWHFDEPQITRGAVVLKTRYLHDESSPRFAAYPFCCTLTLEYTLMSDRLRIAYTVENSDDKALGFGIGFHPFWKIIGSREDVRIQAGLPYHMAAVDMLPTGELEPVAGTSYDLLDPVLLSTLKLDDVYYGATPESVVRFIYDSIGLEVSQTATGDFGHVVVYTPDREYFCIENQTCSTDTHNLYDSGLLRESGLQVLEPGANASGHVEFVVSWNNP